MIDLDTIEREIHDLEARGDTTYSLCERLAWLYIVRDHLAEDSVRRDRRVGYAQGSELLEAAEGKPIASVLAVVGEYAETQKTLHPRAYDALVSKIRAL